MPERRSAFNQPAPVAREDEHEADNPVTPAYSIAVPAPIGLEATADSELAECFTTLWETDPETAARFQKILMDGDFEDDESYYWYFKKVEQMAAVAEIKKHLNCWLEHADTVRGLMAISKLPENEVLAWLGEIHSIISVLYGRLAALGGSTGS